MTILWRISCAAFLMTTIWVVAGMGQEKLIAVANGQWGGTGVNFLVDKSSTLIEYDCAAGEIPGQLKMNMRGNFAADGFHRRIHPGARRANLQPKAQPARYEGKITGKTMRYKVVLKETGELIGVFTAELGKEGRLRRCL